MEHSQENKQFYSKSNKSRSRKSYFRLSFKIKSFDTENTNDKDNKLLILATST
jgi:hypothetical protein